jgi:multiple sugar transport system substrate-binding protein
MNRGVLKRFVVLLPLLLLSTALALAGGKQEPGAGEKVQLDFPHWFFGNEGNFGEWLNGAVDAFQQKYPNIQVNRQKSAYAQYWDQIDTRIAAGNPPDVASFWSANLGKYIGAGALAPLNDLIDMADVKANFSPLQTRDIVAMSNDGKTYCLAFDSGFYLPLYRPSVFKQAGISAYAKTPDEFVDMVGKLSTEGKFGYAFLDVAGNWQEEIIDLFIWTIGFGGQYGDANGKPTLNTPEIVKAVTYLKKMFDAGSVPKDTDKATYQKMFGAGKVGTLIDGMWMYGLLLSSDSTLKGDFATAPLPFPTQRVAAFFEGNSIPKASKHPKEAAKLVEFLSNTEQQTRVVKIIGNLPGRTTVFTEKLKADVLKDNPWFGQFMDHLPQAVNMFPARMPGDLSVQVQKIWGTYLDKVLFDNMDVQDAMNQAQNEAIALFK